MKIIQTKLDTVGDLRRFLQQHQEIPDSVQLASFGPDSGGYDYCKGTDVAISHVEGSNEFLIASGETDDDGKAIWDEQHGNIIGKVRGHVAHLTVLEAEDQDNTITMELIQKLQAAGAVLEPKLYERCLLFGYGTLRSDLGEYSHPCSHLSSLGFGWVEGELWHIENSFGRWAGVKEAKGASAYGEVFEIFKTQLASLDGREQANAEPPYYVRKLVPVMMADGSKVEAYIYFSGDARTTYLERVASGDWKDFLKTQSK